MSINLTPYRIRAIAHPRHGSGKLILAAAERFGPIANLLFVVHAYARHQLANDWLNKRLH
jgi:hypothetical protein